MERRDDGSVVSKNKIDIDPNFHPLVQTTAGAIPLTDERVVGHELGHSVTSALDDGPGQMNNINQNENPIVRALGQPARTQYGPPGDPSGAHVSNPPSFSSHPSFKQCAMAGISCGGSVDVIP
jgi:hypothetical protein